MEQRYFLCLIFKHGEKNNQFDNMVNNMNKKGWMKIVEAFIAILLVSAILLTVYVRQPKNVVNEEIANIEDSVLNEIAGNALFRQDILDDKTEDIMAFLDSRIPGNLNYTIKICAIEDICGLDVYQKEVYAKERIISSTLTEYSPKKIKLFVWEK